MLNDTDVAEKMFNASPPKSNSNTRPIPDDKQTPRRQLQAIDIDKFLELDIPPREMILAPILQTQGSMMFYAMRGVGKTYTALNAAYAVATGGQFLRWTAPAPRRVLYIDGEMPAADMQRRIAEIVAGTGLDLPESDYFRLITPDLQPDGIPDLSSSEGQECLEEHLEGISLIVIDNLSTLCRFGRENEAESWEPVQQWLLNLRRRGISVMLVHHAGKGGAQRGTSKREDTLDTIISLKRPDDYLSEQGARFEVHVEKARGIVGDGAKAFEAVMETRNESAVWSMRDIEDRELDLVRELTEQGLSVRVIERDTGFSKSKVNRLQQRLKGETVDRMATRMPD